MSCNLVKKKEICIFFFAFLIFIICANQYCEGNKLQKVCYYNVNKQKGSKQKRSKLKTSKKFHYNFYRYEYIQKKKKRGRNKECCSSYFGNYIGIINPFLNNDTTNKKTRQVFMGRTSNEINENDSDKKMETNQDMIRNFCILAHIDHGKSTLADRFLESTNTIKKTEMRNQFLDMLSLEREKGITIKLKTVRMKYSGYILNLIDTPGHFDFYHEIKRSVSICEGIILLIDGTKGIQSQTVNIFYELQKYDNRKIIPVINKIDLQTCLLEKTQTDITEKFGLEKEEILFISAKYGYGINNLLQKIINKIPPPPQKSNFFFRALLFDSFYHKYKGIILVVKVLNGSIKKKKKLFFLKSRKLYTVHEVGYFTPDMKSVETIRQGDIAYIAANIRNYDIEIGETIVNENIIKFEPGKTPLLTLKKTQWNAFLEEEKEEGKSVLTKEETIHANNTLKEKVDKGENISLNDIELLSASKVKCSYPSIFCNIYSTNDSKSADLEKSLHKLKLNDSSFFFSRHICETLGKGFQCGFNGLLHLNIIHERIKREHDVDTIITAPTVNYLIQLKKKGIDKKLKEKITDKIVDRKNIYIECDNEANAYTRKNELIEKDRQKQEEHLFFMTSNVNDIPTKNFVDSLFEPYVETNIITPDVYQKYIMNECFKRRGIFKKKDVMHNEILFTFDMPLSEILINFLDIIKSHTKGYGSMSYGQECKYKKSNLYKIQIYINKKCIKSLSFIAHKFNYLEKAKNLLLKLKKLIQPHQFLIVIQAAIESKIFASEKIKPLKKNVTAKCYGGDITRRRKLIAKQNEGKKKMFTIGQVHLPSDIFFKVFELKT